ncbi:hypothetical protein D9613_001812 [Agrocybe pediades]|uniref:Transmembrane protein 135 N-terminal domain-containing protein n=1 Tax=Agrocybe pediades TaxID=84607 RepID=A0A8H4R734_9AGAR|nr:hypothetical protein D9613_001812 [Agrocybe pediades]
MNVNGHLHSEVPTNPSAQASHIPRLKYPTQSWLDRIPTLSDDPTHPIQIALRTYALALSLSLGPSLVPFVASLLSPRSASSRTNASAFKRVLRRELGPDGFAFAVTLSVAGGATTRKYLWDALQGDHTGPHEGEDADATGPFTLKSLWRIISEKAKRLLSGLTPTQQTFLSFVFSSSIGILLIQAGRQRSARLQLARQAATASLSKPTSPLTHPALRIVVDRTSPTLDLTLLLLVRAVDSLLQTFILQKPVPSSPSGNDDHAYDKHPELRLVREKLEKERIMRENKQRQQWTSQVDAFVFWACSARIMWCFFYEPHRLPRSYVKWINTLANLDGRIVDVLQYIRAGTWSYITGSPMHSDLLQKSAQELGLPQSWGNPSAIPARGGAKATEIWKQLGVHSRPGVGGIPCELLHAEVGSSLGLTSSCTANAALRFLTGFKQALAIYLPVHFLPVLLTRPQTLLRPHRLLDTLFGALRSTTFLSSFIGLYWYAVCFTRTFVLARLFPFISHDFWDGPYGCIMAGCLTCGSSIWLENGRRRGEMALYVLPRAVRACLPDKWIKSGYKSINIAERIVFILSFSTLLTAALHRPDSLRGLSRWTLAFVTNGPNAGFWKKKRRDPSAPPTPSVPTTPCVVTDSINGKMQDNTQHLV